MKESLLRLYHLFPYPLKVLAASAWGAYLRWWRYGPETERLIAEALEREYWSPEQWKIWQENRLGYILHRAATKVPYYREYWQQRRRLGDRSSWQYLENWPILEKEALRAKPTAFVAEDCDIRKMYHEHTSGSTGKPLDLWFSRKTVQIWYALFEARWRQWYGVSRFDRWGILGGQLVAPVSRQKPPFWVWNAPLNQLYLSAYHLSASFFPYYLEAIRTYRLTYLWGYSSALYTIAQWLMENNPPDLGLKVIITNAEPLYAHQRQAMEAAFRCPVRETYGMSEAVAAASECEAGSLHLWPEAGVVEIFPSEPTEPGDQPLTGEFLCTGLGNADMPLIKYRVGDRGKLASMRHQCPCGRHLPILEEIEGRCDDVLLTPDGRVIGRMDPVFKAQLPIREAQIVQESLEVIQINLVPAPGFSQAHADELVARMRERLGDMKIYINPVSAIERGPNGKFRGVICKLSSRDSSSK